MIELLANALSVLVILAISAVMAISERRLHKSVRGSIGHQLDR